MDKKHFESIANVLRESLDATETPEARKAVLLTANLLADEFAGSHRDFDHYTFFKTMGLVG